MREIAKEQRLSLRDIGLILKKHRVNHGITLIDDDDNNEKSSNEKATQAYKLFSSFSVLNLDAMLYINFRFIQI